MDLKEILRLLSYIIGLKRPGYRLTVQGYNDLLQMANFKHFKRKVGLPEEYQPGMPLPQQSFDITQKLTDDLRRFKVFLGEDKSPLYIDSTGHAPIPDNYYYISTISYKSQKLEVIDLREVDIVTDTQWNERMTSKIVFPTKKYPIANFQKDYIRFYPKNLNMVDMVYLRYPTNPIYMVVEDSEWNEYSSATSKQLEWSNDNIIDIISIMLGDIGINVGKPEVLQYSNQHKKEGI